MSVEAKFDLAGVRWSRIVDVWNDAAPTEEEIRRARYRFDLRSSSRGTRRHKKLLFAVAQGFVLALATLAPAMWVADRVQLGSNTESGSTPNTAASVRAHARTTHDELPAVPVMTPAPSVAYPSVEPAVPEVSLPRATGTDEHSWQSVAAPVASPAPAARPATAPSPTSSTVTFPATASDASWKRVTEALDRGDWARADQALSELVRNGDPYTRDSADLARVELWLAHGGGLDVRKTLERLADRGKTPLIRHRAAELLARIERAPR